MGRGRGDELEADIEEIVSTAGAFAESSAARAAQC